jgi:hypothetical protein
MLGHASGGGSVGPSRRLELVRSLRAPQLQRGFVFASICGIVTQALVRFAHAGVKKLPQ